VRWQLDEPVTQGRVTIVADRLVEDGVLLDRVGQSGFPSFRRVSFSASAHQRIRGLLTIAIAEASVVRWSDFGDSGDGEVGLLMALKLLRQSFVLCWKERLRGGGLLFVLNMSAICYLTESPAARGLLPCSHRHDGSGYHAASNENPGRDRGMRHPPPVWALNVIDPAV
jgi:hypothetical protein